MPMELTRRKSDNICPYTFISSVLSTSLLAQPDIEEIASQVIPIRAKQGEEIIQEFSPAEYCYVLVTGSAKMYHTEEDESPTHVATLGPGDTFGEEGVITGHHTSTVIMKENGVIYALSKQDFMSNQCAPLLKEITTQEGVERFLDKEWTFLDVRYDFELEMYGKIAHSIHIPLHSLRRRFNELNKNGKYVVFCKSGQRSKAGAVLLAKKGITACSLDGGILAWETVLVERHKSSKHFGQVAA
jgi:rhodanese-related sulfurtransferase